MSKSATPILLPYEYAGIPAAGPEAHIYVVSFDSGGIKVGLAKHPARRIGEHVRNGRVFGRPVVKVWVSIPHVEAVENERELIRHCSGGGPAFRSPGTNEYFEHDFDTTVQFAASLGKTPGKESAATVSRRSAASIPAPRPPKGATARNLDAILPRNVAAERVRRGWTQRELAAHLGWSKTTVAELETGQRKVLAMDLGKLCEVFGVPLLKLAEGADEFQILGL